MDTLPTAPTPGADTRMADLEHQMAELRAEFEALAAGAEHFFEAGRAYERTPRPAASPPWRPRPSHLRLVSGGGQ
jgi:hypothetical protein